MGVARNIYFTCLNTLHENGFYPRKLKISFSVGLGYKLCSVFEKCVEKKTHKFLLFFYLETNSFKSLDHGSCEGCRRQRKGKETPAGKAQTRHFRLFVLPLSLERPTQSSRQSHQDRRFGQGSRREMALHGLRHEK